MKIEEKNTRKKLLGEAAIYGLLSMIYASLFFFGALYPRYGLSTACIEEETEEGAAEEGSETEYEGSEDAENKDVVYKSFFLEYLKEWF